MNLLSAPIFNLLFAASVAALKCKCTQSSDAAECINGVCSITGEPVACLMLNHAVTGVHYACSQSTLQDGDCQERKTKTNITVNICACRHIDFCNFLNWPSNLQLAQRVDEPTIASIKYTASSPSNYAKKFLIFIQITCSFTALFVVVK